MTRADLGQDAARARSEDVRPDQSNMRTPCRTGCHKATRLNMLTPRLLRELR